MVKDMQEEIFKNFSYHLRAHHHQQQQQQQHTNNSKSDTSPSSDDTKSKMHVHQRTPRTPESYFNVPESIALLNIVKSERIQCAFQSNRKNHASVWEMVAGILNKYSNRKRSAKQCCNRYENLKKIYTQLKKNPERHVRRNWPYMYLFREIEEQRGETWGISNKRAASNLLASALNGDGLDNIEIPDLRELTQTGDGSAGGSGATGGGSMQVDSHHSHHHMVGGMNQHHHMPHNQMISSASDRTQSSGGGGGGGVLSSMVAMPPQTSPSSSSLVASIAAAIAQKTAAGTLPNAIGMNGGGGGGNGANNNSLKIKNEISYYQKRKNMVALTNMLMNREVMLTNLNNSSETSESDRLLPNNFVETELHDDDEDDVVENIDDHNDSLMINENCNDMPHQSNNQSSQMNTNNSNSLGGNTNSNNNNNSSSNNDSINNNHGSIDLSMFGLRAIHSNINTHITNNATGIGGINTNSNNNNNSSSNNNSNNNNSSSNASRSNLLASHSNKKRNIQEFGLPEFLSNIKDEPVSDHESCHIDNDKNGHSDYFINGLSALNQHQQQQQQHQPPQQQQQQPLPQATKRNNSLSNRTSFNATRNQHSISLMPSNAEATTNLLNSTTDLTFDANNEMLSDSSNVSLPGMGAGNNNKRRKSSTSETDGGESTNYELIEYLRRREKRDEEMYRRMNDREERLINLLERTVVAFERIAAAGQQQLLQQQITLHKSPTPSVMDVEPEQSADTTNVVDGGNQETIERKVESNCVDDSSRSSSPIQIGESNDSNNNSSNLHNKKEIECDADSGATKSSSADCLKILSVASVNKSLNLDAAAENKK